MKPTCFFALFLLLGSPSPLSAQYFERTFDPAFYTEVVDLIPDPNADLLLLTSGQGSEGLETLFATRLDSQGNSLTFPLSGAGTILEVQLLPVPGGYVVFTGFFECDIIYPPFIRFLDLNGAVVWSRPAEDFQIDFDQGFRFLPAPDNTFWIFRDQDTPVRVDLNGSVIDNGLNLPVLPLFDFFFETPGHQYIVYGPDGFARYDATLTSVLNDTVDLPYLKDIAQLDNGDLVGVDEINLYRLDTNLNLIKQEQHFLSPFAIHQVAAGDSAIWVLFPGQALARYDLDLVQQQLFAVADDEPFSPRRLEISAGRLVLAGDEVQLATGSHTGVVAVRSTPPEAPYFSAATDAGVSNIKVESVVGYPLGFAAYRLNFQNVRIMATNYGEAPLHELTIKGTLGTLFGICPFGFGISQTFEGLNIAPGDSAELELDTLQVYTQFGFPATYELCLRSVLPNDSLDRNHANNESCKTFQITLGLIDPAPAQPLLLFPNPALAGTRIEWPEAAGSRARLRVHDAAGHLILDEPAEGNQRWLATAAFPAGLYLVTIAAENGQHFLGKLIVEKLK